ncbi:MAG: transporter [Ferruginibacter sp.]|nr:transporter [Ferruginibacter sp.]
MTQIHLQQVAPVFLEAEKLANSQLWKQSLSFAKGGRIQIVAPSGSGKTSLIHFLYGMRKDYSGTIQFDQQKMSDVDAEEMAVIRSSQLSIIFQDLRLFPDHSAAENISIKRLLAPYHKEPKIEEMARHLGIHSKLGQLAKTCSYGEQQRVAIIRALQQPFDFLILDEPFSHLDERNRQKAMELIEAEASDRKAAIILADLKPIEYFKADQLYKL